jgi:hypothetical protein
MKKKYAIKNFLTGEYLTCNINNWSNDVFLSKLFDDYDEAIKIIETFDGLFMIETIYSI